MTIQSIFNAALDIADATERGAFLDKECAGDPALRHRVEALLNAHFRDEKFLEEGPAQLPTVEAATSAYVAPIAVQSIIAGRYKIREKLGEGGMGTVYVVETVKDVKTFFALKLIKPGINSRQVLARFNQERQALAMMNHPNIAKFIDAGITETGQPFFVMELIKGLPITKFCDQEKLTVEERLNLFKPICKAVQHAHQKGIIHRDLKPGNILVAIYDGVPVPKVIDFGVAKATLQPLTDQSIYTEINSMIGTLEYMAPEQAEVNSLDIDTRADLYSLGVILYELMTGTVPFSREELSAAAMVHLLELLKKEEPQKPSTKISGSGSLPSVAASRKIDPAALTKKLKGELDWIVMKCLEKERNRRYDGPLQLGQDIENYLTDLPLIAGPPSTMYRTKKFLKRNKGKVIAAAALLLSLVGGIIGTSWGMVKAVRAEKVAEVEAATANATRDFVEKDILQQVDHYVQANAGYLVDKDIKLRTLLDRAAEKVNSGSLSKEPITLASIELTIGKAYLAAGSVDKALPHLKKSAELRTSYLGKDHVQTLQTRYWLCKQLSLASKHKEAGAAAKELERDILAHSPEAASLLWDTRYSLAQSLEKTSQYEEAKQLFRQVHAERNKVLGENHHQTLIALQNVANCLRLQRENDEAERTYRLVIEKQRAFLSKDHPDLLVTMSNLGGMYMKPPEQFRRAEEVFQEVVDKAKSIYPPEHPVMMYYINNLLAARAKLGVQNEVLKTYLELHEASKASRGKEHEGTLDIGYNIAALYFMKKQYDESERWYLSVLQHYEGKYGRFHSSTVSTYRSLSLVKEKQGDLAAAEQYAEKTLAGIREQKPVPPLTLFIELMNVSEVKLKINKPEPASILLLEAGKLRSTAHLQLYHQAKYHRLSGQLAIQQGKLEDARKQLMEAATLIKSEPKARTAGTFATGEREEIRKAASTLFDLTGKKDKNLETILSELK